MWCSTVYDRPLVLPPFITFNCYNQPLIVCDRWTDVGKGGTLTLWSLSFSLSLSQIKVNPAGSDPTLHTSIRWDVTHRPSNTHTGSTASPSCKTLEGDVCVKRQRECLCVCVFVLLNPLVPFHLEVRGQHSNQSQLPSAPHLDTFCMCLRVCVCVFPLQLSISKTVHDCVCAGMYVTV